MALTANASTHKLKPCEATIGRRPPMFTSSSTSSSVIPTTRPTNIATTPITSGLPQPILGTFDTASYLVQSNYANGSLTRLQSIYTDFFGDGPAGFNVSQLFNESMLEDETGEEGYIAAESINPDLIGGLMAS